MTIFHVIKHLPISEIKSPASFIEFPPVVIARWNRRLADYALVEVKKVVHRDKSILSRKILNTIDSFKNNNMSLDMFLNEYTDYFVEHHKDRGHGLGSYQIRTAAYYAAKSEEIARESEQALLGIPYLTGVINADSVIAVLCYIDYALRLQSDLTLPVYAEKTFVALFTEWLKEELINYE